MRFLFPLLLALCGACSAAGTSGSDPIASLTSTSTKADGTEGAASWNIYADGATMTWVATDGSGVEQSRITFRQDTDALWLDVESVDLAFASIGLDTSGTVIAGPTDESEMFLAAELVAEAVLDSSALVAEDSKADVDEVPAACREVRDLTAGQLLRLCASSFGAYFRLFTGRGYDESWVGIFQVFADIVTPHACVAGMGELVRGPGTITRYCDNPSRLQIASTGMNCRPSFDGLKLCDLTVEVGIDRALPTEFGEQWVTADVYDAAGERRGFGFPRATPTGRWATTLTVWDVRPGETFSVRATGDLVLSAQSSITAPR